MNSNEYNRNYYKLNKERLLQLQKESRSRNKESISAYKKAYRKANKDKIQAYQTQYKLLDIKKYIWSRTKSLSKRRGQEFNLDVEDIIIPTHCPYMGVELTLTLDAGQVQTNYSIDRIDSTKGYIKGNVQIISRLANVMKQNATLEQLLTFAKGVIALHG